MVMRESSSLYGKRAYRINEVPETYGIGRTKVYELINDGTLRTVKVGGRRLILADSLEALIDGGAK
jgi:excisionase family DNA binding protein